RCPYLLTALWQFPLWLDRSRLLPEARSYRRGNHFLQPYLGLATVNATPALRCRPPRADAARITTNGDGGARECMSWYPYRRSGGAKRASTQRSPFQYR